MPWFEHCFRRFHNILAPLSKGGRRSARGQCRTRRRAVDTSLPSRPCAKLCAMFAFICAEMKAQEMGGEEGAEPSQAGVIADTPAEADESRASTVRPKTRHNPPFSLLPPLFSTACLHACNGTPWTPPKAID